MKASDKQRLEYLSLFISLSPEEETELNRLRTLVGPSRESPVSLDFGGDDPDPESVAARMHTSWTEQYDKEQQRNQRNNALAERYYAKESKRMNSYGFSQQ
jgi:hypothetical protein